MSTVLTRPSTPEVLLHYLESYQTIKDLAAGGVFWGPASEDAKQLGCISITEIPDASPEATGLVVRARLTVRCTAPSVEHGERLYREVCKALDWYGGRLVLAQPSWGRSVVLHSLRVVGGPTNRPSDPQSNVWEGSMTIEALIGTIDTSEGA